MPPTPPSNKTKSYLNETGVFGFFLELFELAFIFDAGEQLPDKQQGQPDADDRRDNHDDNDDRVHVFVTNCGKQTRKGRF